MVDLAMLQVVRDLVAIFGVITGFSYYVLTVRNADKIRKQTVANELARDLSSQDFIGAFYELTEMEWEDYDDYLSKYDSTVNRDNYIKRTVIWYTYNRLGYELYRENIDIETLHHILGYQGTWVLWNKFKPILREYRKRYNIPDFMRWIEYLFEEMKKEREIQGLPTIPRDPEGYLVTE
ncbi:MAG: hypothetical protein JSV27_10500 [Candidatus Bathyarchaeota archaeon]|nr:MAG: hypothetical protein JSV27_10500 [Candidatus Bathyarchaeota archaeon]